MVNLQLHLGPIELLSNSAFKEVYRVNGIYVAKRHTLREKSYLDETEFDNTRKLYKGGINVPRPVGIVKLSLNGNGKSFPFFIREFIEGPSLDNIRFRWRKEYLMKREIDKAMALGAIPGDGGLRNAIWSTQEKKVYLIDFEHWFIK